MNLQEIRQRYPQYNDLDDETLLSGLHSKHYADMPIEDFYSKVGYAPGIDPGGGERDDIPDSGDMPANEDFSSIPQVEEQGNPGLDAAKSIGKQALRFGPNLARTVNQGIGFTGGLLESGAKSAKEATGDFLGMFSPYEKIGKAVKEYGLGAAKDVKKALEHPFLNLPPEKQKRLWDNPQYLLDPEWMAYNAGDAVQSLGLVIAGGMAAGPAGAIAVGGGMEGLDLYDELIESGADQDKAASASVAFGIVSGLLNKIGADKVMSKPTGNLLKRAAKRLVSGSTEATTEWAEEPFQAAFGELAKGKSVGDATKAASEALKNVDVIPGAFIAGGAMSSRGTPTQKQAETPKEEETLSPLRADFMNGELTLDDLTQMRDKAPDEIKVEIDRIFEESKGTQASRESGVGAPPPGPSGPLRTPQERQAFIDQEFGVQRPPPPTPEMQRQAEIDRVWKEQEAQDQAEEDRFVQEQQEKREAEQPIESVSYELDRRREAAELERQRATIRPPGQQPTRYEEPGDLKTRIRAELYRLQGEGKRANMHAAAERVADDIMLRDEQENRISEVGAMARDLAGKWGMDKAKKETIRQTEDEAFTDWARKAASREVSNGELLVIKKMMERAQEDDTFRQWQIKSQQAQNYPSEMTFEGRQYRHLGDARTTGGEGIGKWQVMGKDGWVPVRNLERLRRLDGQRKVEGKTEDVGQKADDLSYKELGKQVIQFKGKGGIASEARTRGMEPAFRDNETGKIYPSMLEGEPSSVHMLDGLPDEVVTKRNQFGEITAVKGSIEPGFVKGGKFFTREEAVAEATKQPTPTQPKQSPTGTISPLPTQGATGQGESPQAQAGRGQEGIKQAQTVESLREKETALRREVQSRRAKGVKNAKTFREWVALSGGVNPNDQDWRGEFKDLRFGLKGQKKVSAKGFPPGFWNNSARGLDELTDEAINAGWLPKGATDEDFHEAIVGNPSIKAMDSGEGVDKWMEEAIESELEARYGTSDLEELERRGVGADLEEDSIQEDAAAEIEGEGYLPEDVEALLNEENRESPPEDAANRKALGGTKLSLSSPTFTPDPSAITLRSLATTPEGFRGRQGVRLGDVVDYPALYDTYPELRNYKLNIIIADKVSSRFVNHEKNLLEIRAKTEEQAKELIAKELEKAIQDVEGGRQTRLSVSPENTETPEFKRWFGKSKVVDENGKPLVVYHGTTAAPITAFKPELTGRRTHNYYKGGAIFFTSNAEAASAYAARPAPGGGFHDLHPLDEPNVTPAYLSFQNPLIVDAEGKSWTSVTEDAIKEARAKGNDGVIIRNVLDHASALTAIEQGEIDTFIAFSPTQIKSIFNRGTWNPKDANISASLGTPTPTPREASELKQISKDATNRIFRIIPPEYRNKVNVVFKPLIDLKAVEGAKQSIEEHGGKTEGRYVLGMTEWGDLADTITISYHFDDGTIAETAYHEPFHVVFARLMPDKHKKALLHEHKNEEQAAKAFGRWAVGKEKEPLKPYIQRIFEQIKKTLEGIRRVWQGKGFTTPEAIFEKIWGQKYRDLQAGKQSGIMASMAKKGEGRNIPAASPKAEGGAKKPWQMTREEYAKSVPYMSRDQALFDHGEFINDAFWSDLPIPEAVLREYQRLQKSPAVFYGGERAQRHAKTPLETAKTLERSGLDSVGIEKQTGWKKLPNGKWKFKVDAGDVKLKFPIHKEMDVFFAKRALTEDELYYWEKNRERFHRRPQSRTSKFEQINRKWLKVVQNVTLQDVIDAPKLFEVYPELENIKIQFRDRSPASYAGVIVFGGKDLSFGTAERAKRFKSALVHEIQHQIQVLEKDELFWTSHGETTRQNEAYYNHPSEVEARQAEIESGLATYDDDNPSPNRTRPPESGGQTRLSLSDEQEDRATQLLRKYFGERGIAPAGQNLPQRQSLQIVPLKEMDIEEQAGGKIAFQTRPLDLSKDGIKDLAAKAYTSFFMQEYPVKRLAAKAGPDIEKRVEEQIRRMRGTGGITEAILTANSKTPFLELAKDGITEYSHLGDTSLQRILKPINTKGLYRDYERMREAERDLAFWKHRQDDIQAGKLKGIDPKNAEKVIDLLKEKYGADGFKRLQDISRQHTRFEQDAVLRTLLKSGWMSQEQYDAIMDRPESEFYASYLREMEEVEKQTVGGGGDPVKRIYGSERKKLPSTEGTIGNILRTVRLVEKLRLNNQLVGLKDLSPDLAEVIQEKKPRFQATTITFPRRDAQNRFIKDKDGKRVYQTKKVAVPVGAPANTITVAEGGKKKYYELPQDVMSALDNYGPKEMNALFKIMSYPTRLLRAGATLSAEFIARNPVRDQYSAFVYSKYGYNPFTDFAKGIFHAIKKDDLYKEFKAAGGENSFFVSLDRQAVNIRARDMTGQGNKIKYVKNPVEALRILSEFSEKGTRVGLYGKAKAKGATTQEAMTEAREGTLDFGRVGTEKALNQIIAFWNASLQGTDKLFREMKNGRAVMKAVMGITLPSIALWMLNHDDDRYKELPEWRKNFFWNIITSKNMPIISIPKPFELGLIFGSLPERILDWIYLNDKDAMKDIAVAAGEGIMPSLIPTAALPVIEHLTNYSFFRGQELEPKSLENLPEWMHYTAGTTNIAKKAGKIVDVSPVKIENWVRDWTGSLGYTALANFDKAFMGDDTPDVGKHWYEMTPGVKGFISREPIGSGSKSVDKFYENAKEAMSAEAGYKFLAKHQEGKEAQAYAKEERKKIALSKGARNEMANMTAIRQQINAIIDNKTMPSGEKREKVDRLNELITMRAKQFNQVYDKMMAK